MQEQLGVDIAWMLIIPVESETTGDFLNDPPVGAGVAGGLERLAAELHAAVGVGEGAVFFGKRGRGQHHVGVERGLGQEQVLHDEMVELRQGLRARGGRRDQTSRDFHP